MTIVLWFKDRYRSAGEGTNAVWDPELAELERRERLAERMGGEERVARQHATGRLTIRERLAALTDSWREVGALTGQAVYGEDGLESVTPSNVIIGRAVVAGRRVVVAGDDPRVYGGGMTAQGADKTARFVDLAETFHLPVVHLVDQPGFVIGSAAERAGTIRHGARALAAVYQSTIPWASVLVRRVFGVAGAAHRSHDRYGLRVAWPSGDWGSLPIEGGLEVAFKRLLAEAGPEAETLKAEIAERLEAVRSPFRTAEAFLVEDIIDPARTRPVLTEWVHDAYAVLDPGPRHTTRP
ncbi:carboxyl transferase domain-containing protein [Nonomuraea sp. NPDC050022]|uniref:carboxyl transferase domain-containing protein n=1 Tax=Nonomuraea sp. NPDC050022 TaxID=3364358 RepID=UPI0037BB592A